jgi:SAM-dependent methyltransferase
MTQQSQPHSFEYSGEELELFAGAVNWKRYWSDEIGEYIGDRVIELGAGIGLTALTLSKKTYKNWTAVEPDRSMHNKLESLAADGKFGSYYNLIYGTSKNLQPNSQFDTALYIDVLEHIEDDVGELIRISQHLCRGGHIIIVAPAHNFLYTAFDRKVGHFRRYNRKMLVERKPDGMIIEKLCYLDSAGLIASTANKLLLNSENPTYDQIQIWDRYMVRTSRWIDPIFRYKIGKSVVGIFRKP